MQQLAIWLVKNIGWLRSQLVRRGRTREEAEDLIQEAYLRVHEYCEHGGEAREPEKVLVRTVMRLSMNERRDSHRHLYVNRSPEQLSYIDPTPPAEEVLVAQEALHRTMRILESLEPRSREALLLHRMDGLTYTQIAKQLGVSISAVEKHIAWAMAVLMDAAAQENRKGGPS